MIATLLTIAACHVGGHVPLVTPDNACTPGAYDDP
jgi:predicted small lipoprotein YifL